MRTISRLMGRSIRQRDFVLARRRAPSSISIAYLDIILSSGLDAKSPDRSPLIGVLHSDRGPPRGMGRPAAGRCERACASSGMLRARTLSISPSSNWPSSSWSWISKPRRRSE